MPQTINDVTPSGDTAGALYVAVEVSTKSWVVGISIPGAPNTARIHTLGAGDAAGLIARIRKAQDMTTDRILLTYEVGYEGFWLARWLHQEAPDIAIVMCDPASLEVVRRAKVAKTDPIDARRMVRALVAWDRGEAGALARVRIPTLEEEDAKRLMRHRERLVRTRVRLHNTIRGRLRLHGITDLAPGAADFDARLPHLRTPFGKPLPAGIRWEIACLRDQRAVIVKQLAAIEVAKAERVAPSTRPDGTPSMEATLVQLVGIGSNDATLLGAEVFYRDFRNRRELAAWAGLVAVPWASGTVAHDQGISKAGNPLVRKHLIQMAWRWVRFQPDSPITQWFHAYCTTHHGRARKRAIVAVARKLLIALWRFATNGLIPTGARLVA